MQPQAIAGFLLLLAWRVLAVLVLGLLRVLMLHCCMWKATGKPCRRSD
jgi:hypothetical protein